MKMTLSSEMFRFSGTCGKSERVQRAGRFPPSSPLLPSTPPLTPSLPLPRRICHCEGDEGPLITPCHCTGSLRFVHQSCLQQWIKSSDTRCCELCKYEFIMETKLKPLRKVRPAESSAPPPPELLF